MHHSLRLRKLNTALLAALFAVGLGISLGASNGDAETRGTGGISITSPSSDSSNAKVASRFGNRTLRQGMSGGDVRVLNGIVRSKQLLNAPLTTNFDPPTTSAVKRFQKGSSIKPSGVVNRSTSKTLVRSLRRTEASWYGPGLYGNGVACGGTLRRGTIGVAHKTLPCGSKVMVGYRGRFLMTKVIDRGPYIRGRALDLTYAGAEALGFIDAGVANVRYAVVKRK
jgi:rare lipoprotein A (peptidoglycan hydrolase)